MAIYIYRKLKVDDNCRTPFILGQTRHFLYDGTRRSYSIAFIPKHVNKTLLVAMVKWNCALSVGVDNPKLCSTSFSTVADIYHFSTKYYFCFYQNLYVKV